MKKLVETADKTVIAVDLQVAVVVLVYIAILALCEGYFVLPNWRTTWETNLWGVIATHLLASGGLLALINGALAVEVHPTDENPWGEFAAGLGICVGLVWLILIWTGFLPPA